MKAIRSAILIMAALGIIMPLTVSGEEMKVRLNHLRSKLKSMSHGQHSKKEWNDLLYELDVIAEEAQSERRLEEVVEIGLLHTMVYMDLQKNYPLAIKTLKELKTRYAYQSPVLLRKVYGRLAEAYAVQGDELAIRGLIKEFKSSPSFDSEQYGYSGGQGRDVPLKVVRPSVEKEDSITITAMEKYLNQARLASGRMFPPFEAIDSKGRKVNLEAYRGQVVLVDFWLSGWKPWLNRLPYLTSIYNRYRNKGFVIIGMCLDLKGESLNQFAKTHRMTWSQIYGRGDVARKMGIFGEATSFLVSTDGVILGRDLNHGDMVSLIKRELNLK